MDELIKNLIITYPLVCFSLVVHEVAHAWTAYKLGDDTAKNEGRLTLNPKAHIDPITTLLLPLVLTLLQSPIVIGWAIPVPVNMYRLYKPKRDMGIVALAGPVSNFILAIIGAFIIRLLSEFNGPSLDLSEGATTSLIYKFVFINLYLGAFNLFPILPLDGGRILVALLPAFWTTGLQKLQPYGFIIVIFLLKTPIIEQFLTLILTPLILLVTFIMYY